MLIQFTVSNFRSFLLPQTLSMVSKPSLKNRQHHAFDPGVEGLPPLLRSAVVYGPNAAGKTNLLRAIQLMQAMVLTSVSEPSNIARAMPFSSQASRSKPTRFAIAFVQDDIRYEYEFAVRDGIVEQEKLVEYVNPRGRTLFARLRNSYKFSTHLKGQREVWKNATRPGALFLSTAVQLNSAQLRPVVDWFRTKLVVIVGEKTLNAGLTLRMLSEHDAKERLLPFLQVADAGIADFVVKREPIQPGSFFTGPVMIDQQPGAIDASRVVVKIQHVGGDNLEPWELDFGEESGGTQTLFNTAGAWLNVLLRGETLLIDEIDSSLHVKLLHFLLSQFHSNRMNPNNAQLIFSTHNTTLLNQELFRRDQFWFVEKQSNSSSRLYPLTDFSPRNDEALERAYLSGRYGALPLFEEVPE